jgi:hypothetical protein
MDKSRQPDERSEIRNQKVVIMQSDLMPVEDPRVHRGQVRQDLKKARQFWQLRHHSEKEVLIDNSKGGFMIRCTHPAWELVRKLSRRLRSAGTSR